MGKGARDDTGWDTKRSNSLVGRQGRLAGWPAGSGRAFV
jgi:hypothetical protein